MELPIPEDTKSTQALETGAGPLRLIYLKEFLDVTGLTAAEVRRLIANGKLISPRLIHYRGRAWQSDYVAGWMKEQNLP